MHHRHYFEDAIELRNELNEVLTELSALQTWQRRCLRFLELLPRLAFATELECRELLRSARR